MKKSILFSFFLAVGLSLAAQPSADKLQQKGLAAAARKQWSRAENYFKKVISLDLSYISAYTELAKVNWAAKEFETALSYLNQAINLQPNVDSLYLLRSEGWSLLAMSGLMEEAPCMSCPSDMKHLYNSLNESSASFMRDALQDAKKAVEINPKSPQANYRCGWIEYLLSNQEAACRYFGAAKDLGHKEAERQWEEYCGGK